MTPQLQQAIRLLQLPLLELNTRIEEALAENVMLESEEPEPQTPEVEEPAVVTGEVEDTNLWAESGISGGGTDWSDDSRRPELADRSDETLQDHLLWQLEMEHFSPREVVIGQALVDAINDDGYLPRRWKPSRSRCTARLISASRKSSRRSPVCRRSTRPASARGISASAFASSWVNTTSHSKVGTWRCASPTAISISSRTTSTRHCDGVSARPTRNSMRHSRSFAPVTRARDRRSRPRQPSTSFPTSTCASRTASG